MTETRTAPERDTEQLEELCINTIRTLSMDAVERADSGHPGAPMGLAPVAYVLWTKFLKHNPADPAWIDRDRFILSAGHASMLIYSLLHLTGYDLPLEELKNFRQWKSRTPGHPEYRHTPGIETTTGPLGQGFGNGVGMAMAERYLAERFNRPGFPIVDHYTYAIVSDGDLMEGVASEAASLAGHLRLDKLVYVYDSNRISIDGSTDLAFTEDVGARFAAYGWHVDRVDDGNDLPALQAAISEARRSDRPSLVIVRTHIGYGAPTKQDSESAHGAPLGAEEVRGAKVALGWDPDAEFHVPQEASAHFRRSARAGAQAQQAWRDMFEEYGRAHPEDAAEFERMVAGHPPDGWDDDLPRFGSDQKVATRKASHKAINTFAPRLPEMVGGSADLTGSNNTDIKGADIFAPGRSGRNVHFGVREHAMGAALNGMALHGGLRPFGGTFLIFSDYCRPSVRLAALMGAPSIFVFTHDSVGLGEDGPTHQPIEHLASLRAMPGLIVIRPGDPNETVQAWRVALAQRAAPVALCLTRQNLPVLEQPGGGDPPVEKGAYVLYEPDTDPEVLLLATGSEVAVARDAAELLARDGMAARVVSMPSWELFARQPADYREQVIPSSIRARVSVEAAATLGWCRWVGDYGEALGLDRFGASAPGGVVMTELGFTPENVAQRARASVERARAAGSHGK